MWAALAISIPVFIQSVTPIFKLQPSTFNLQPLSVHRFVRKVDEGDPKRDERNLFGA
jgi:hypothetical protein